MNFRIRVDQRQSRALNSNPVSEIYIRKAQTYLSVCPERSQNTKQRKCIGFNPSTQTT